MRKIRIGKSIAIAWPILTNGERKDLAGRDLTLSMTTPEGNEVELEIEHTRGHILYCHVTPAQQTVTGIYWLTLTENANSPYTQSKVDYVGAFRLTETTATEDPDNIGDIASAELLLSSDKRAVNVHAHALYKGDYDLADTTLSEEIDAEEQEYRDGRWWFRGAVKIVVPHKGDYMLRLFGTEGSADIRVGDNYYAPGGDINISLQDVSEIAFETEDWLSMDRIVTVEDGIIKLPTKLSELENDIIGVDTRQHMIYLVARDESIQV